MNDSNTDKDKGQQKESGNQGVIISGSTIQGNQMAFGGAGSRIEINVAQQNLTEKGLDEISVKLEELVQAIQTHSSELEDEPEIEQAVQTVAEELGKDNPNKLSIKGILNGVIESVQSVSAVASAALALKEVVIQLL